MTDSQIGRRALLRGVLATAGLGFGAAAPRLMAQRGAGGGAGANVTLALTRFLNATAYQDLPPKAIDHAKMILASTLASAAVGSSIESARIPRSR